MSKARAGSFIPCRFFPANFDFVLMSPPSVPGSPRMTKRQDLLYSILAMRTI